MPQELRRPAYELTVDSGVLPGSADDQVAGSTRDALDEVVTERDIDVVVTGAVSRGRIERLLIGSTAEAILDDVHCDVVVVKPDSFPETHP